MRTRPGTYRGALMADDMALGGLMKSHLAQAAGVSGRTVADFLSGKVQTAKVARRLAEALGRPVSRYYVPRDPAGRK